jgi:hypothetical protein
MGTIKDIQSNSIFVDERDLSSEELKYVIGNAGPEKNRVIVKRGDQAKFVETLKSVFDGSSHE